MLNFLTTILTYMQLISDKQHAQMKDSQMLQTTHMVHSNKVAEITKRQTQEEAMVELKFDDEEISNEEYTQIMDELSEIQDKYGNELTILAAKVSADEQTIQMRITAREPVLKQLQADLENLEEAMDKDIESEFTYCE